VVEEGRFEVGRKLPVVKGITLLAVPEGVAGGFVEIKGGDGLEASLEGLGGH